MNIIKKLYLRSLAEKGLSLEQLRLLVSTLENTPKGEYLRQEFNWQLDGLVAGNMNTVEIADVLRAYFKHNETPGFFVKELIGKSAGYCYLHTLETRRVPFASHEQESVLEMPLEQFKELSAPLSNFYFQQLLDSRDEAKIAAYLHNFLLDADGEDMLLDRVIANKPDARLQCDYHALARGYVLDHFGQAFKSDEVQKKLFIADNYDALKDVSEVVLNQCSMRDPFLTDDVVKMLIEEMSIRLLRRFLSLSYIRDKQALEILLKKRIPVNIEDLLNLAQLKLSIVQVLKMSGYWAPEYDDIDSVFCLSEREQEWIAQSNSDEFEQCLKTEIVAALLEGKISPTMASWLVWKYPQYSQLARPAVFCVNACLQNTIRRVDRVYYPFIGQTCLLD